MARSRLKRDNRGFRRLKRNLNVALTRSAFEVGVANADRVHPSGGATIGDVAIFQEFGTDTIPERSFMRSTLAANRGRYIRGIFGSVKKVIETSRLSEMRKLAERVASDIRRTIEAGVPPPLADGSGRTPLIDTGTLRDSIGVETISPKELK